VVVVVVVVVVIVVASITMVMFIMRMARDQGKQMIRVGDKEEEEEGQ